MSGEAGGRADATRVPAGAFSENDVSYELRPSPAVYAEMEAWLGFFGQAFSEVSIGAAWPVFTQPEGRGTHVWKLLEAVASAGEDEMLEDTVP